MILGDHQRKIRPKVVYDILLKESDEMHPMSTNEIIERLKERGISAERKTLYEDIKLLNAYGYEVLSERGRSNYYYVVDRSFDIAELRILTDAVDAARFVTAKKTAALEKKLTELAGRTGKETLGAKHLRFDVVKLKNENIFYNVDTLDACISAGKKCSFLYFDYDFEGKRSYRKDMEPYIVSPVQMLFEENNYYLLAVSEHPGITAYRVDRMDRVTMEADDAETGNVADISEFRKQVFSMYGGEAVNIELECDESYVNVIVDKFGFDVTMLKLPGNAVRIKVKVQLSPTFFGWLATGGGKIRIAAPDTAIEQYREHLLKCMPQKPPTEEPNEQ